MTPLRYLLPMLNVILAGHPVVDCMPPIESTELRQIFADEWTLFYDSRTMPRITMDGTRLVSQSYQFNSDGNQTNPSNEYPWKTGGGLHAVESRDVAILKFYWHPDHQPVRYFASRRRNGFANRVIDNMYDWTFPVDSVVGEIIAIRRSDGTFPIEVRTLTREADAWEPRVYRQVNERNVLADRVWELGYQDVAHDIGSSSLNTLVLRDPIHNPPAIEREYKESILPTLPEPLARQLLDEPLREVVYPSELTARQTQILPANYRPAHVGSGREDCIQCHRHVGVHAQYLDRPGRDWYAHLSGSGKTENQFGIFSFHPFEPSSIGGEARFNQRLIASGHIAPGVGR